MKKKMPMMHGKKAEMADMKEAKMSPGMRAKYDKMEGMMEMPKPKKGKGKGK